MNDMSAIVIVEREITKAELDRMHAGFDEHATEHGNPPHTPLRVGFVAIAGETFVGCASGLINDNGRWFYLTDLFVEKPFRRQDLGTQLLHKLEAKVALLGVERIWTWTAGYEAPGFYRKQGYEVFCEMENYYPSGHSRIGLWKHLRRSESA